MTGRDILDSGTLRVSGHAISRYRRRVAPVDYDTARAALSTETIRQAALAGMCSVILPSGHKVVLNGFKVVTVKPRHSNKKRVR